MKFKKYVHKLHTKTVAVFDCPYL